MKCLKSKYVAVGFLAMSMLTGCQDTQDDKKQQADTQDRLERQQDASSLSEVIAFSGVDVSAEEQAEYVVTQGAVNFCINSDEGGIYYVKLWEKNRGLYYWNQGEEKKMLDQFVSQLCYYDGTLYFLYDETGKTFDPDITPSYEGVLASVDTKTGEYRVLSEEKAKLLYVTKDGIYCQWMSGPDQEQTEISYSFYSWEEEQMKTISAQDTYLFQEHYGRYVLLPKYEAASETEKVCIGRMLKDSISGEEIMLWGEEKEAEIFGAYLVWDRLFYAMEQEGETVWYCINLSNGEEQKVPFSQQEADSTHFIWTGDLFCKVRNQDIVSYYPENRHVGSVSVKRKTQDTTYRFSGLAWDGTYFYTMLQEISYAAKDEKGCYGWRGVMAVGADDYREVWNSLERK